MLELNSCRLRMQAQPIIFCNQEQLNLKILTENWKRKLKLVRQCYFFLVQPSFSLQQCWQQKKIVLPSLSNPSTMFALLKIVLSLRTEKEFERLFSREGYIHGLCFLEPTLSIYFTSHFSRCAYQHISHVAYFCGFRF